MKPLLIISVLAVSLITVAESEISNAPPPAENGVAMGKQIQDLRKAVRDWEDRVDESRKVLDTILKTKKIIHKQDTPKPEESPEDQKLIQSYETADLRIRQIELDIARLTYLEGEELIRRAAAMDVKDNPVRKLVAKAGKTHAGDTDTSGGESLAAMPEMKAALDSLLKLLNDDLREVMKNQPEPKWAIYWNAESSYQFDKEQLDIMRAALARLEARETRQKMNIK